MTTSLRIRNALRPISRSESLRIRAQFPDRIAPSKLVLTEKVGEDGIKIVKARWTARGDKDPDLFSLVREGKTQAPTISSNGRFIVMQTIASMQWQLELGDVTGAFLEADNLVRSNGKLYMSQPNKYPIPGNEPDQLFEVIRPIYGLNDSPQQWFLKFKTTAKRARWTQSVLDPCVFHLWSEHSQQLQGILGVHVDDVLCGGQGPVYEAALGELKQAFPFRKWEKLKGMFCGSWLEQNPSTFAISVSQESFVDKLEKQT